MADFKTHAAVGIVSSGMLATLTMAANVAPPHDLVTLALAGALGAILPDIDLENSRASQGMFSGLGIFLAFAILFNVSWKYSVAEMWIIWVGTFLVVRFAGHSVFHKYARHRGVFHSLLAGLFFAFTTSAVYYHLFGADATLSWLAGLFLFVGVLSHLLLDELFSVDFHGNRVKRSFGTALKLYDGRAPTASLTMAGAAALALLAAPPADAFLTIMSSEALWALLPERMLPKGSWFGFIAEMDRLAFAGLGG